MVVVKNCNHEALCVKYLFVTGGRHVTGSDLSDMSLILNLEDTIG